MGYLLSAPVLAPLLILQGWLVRRRVPRLPEPPGARAGIEGSGTQLRILILGDSSAAGVGAPSQDAALAGQLVRGLKTYYRVEWQLAARTGATTESTLQALHEQATERFDCVVLSLGVNDVTSGVSEVRWRTRQAELRALLRSRFRVSQILVSGLPPVCRFPSLPQPLRWFLGSRAARFSWCLEHDVAAEPDCTFLRLDFSENTALMAPDGFHPGPAIYAAWGARAADMIHSMRSSRRARHRTGPVSSSHNCPL